MQHHATSRRGLGAGAPGTARPPSSAGSPFVHPRLRGRHEASRRRSTIDQSERRRRVRPGGADHRRGLPREGRRAGARSRARSSTAGDAGVQGGRRRRDRTRSTGDRGRGERRRVPYEPRGGQDLRGRPLRARELRARRATRRRDARRRRRRWPRSPAARRPTPSSASSSSATPAPSEAVQGDFNEEMRQGGDARRCRSPCSSSRRLRRARRRGHPAAARAHGVLGTMGLVGPVSQLAPVDAAIKHVILLIGLAVGVDYALFYLRREREERAAGRTRRRHRGRRRHVGPRRARSPASP